MCIWCIRKIFQNNIQINGGEFYDESHRKFSIIFCFILWNYALLFQISTKQLLSSCKTEIAKPDPDKNSFVTVLTVIAVVCIACVMVFLFKEPRQDHSDKHNHK